MAPGAYLSIQQLLATQEVEVPLRSAPFSSEITDLCQKCTVSRSVIVQFRPFCVRQSPSKQAK